MLKQLTYSLLVLTLAAAVGCSSKKKEGEGGDALAGGDAGQMGADISEKPLSFDPMGSDSGSIAGLSTVNFEYNSDALTGQAKELLVKNAEWLKGNVGTTIQIEGHCDSQGSNEYNMTLGERRANAVKSFLTAQGIESGRMSTISYGEEKLLAMGDSEGDHAKNRRANFVPAK